MFASKLEGVEASRVGEVAERMAARERDAVREKEREEMLFQGGTTGGKGGIGAMIENDRERRATETMAAAVDVSVSDVMSSIYSDDIGSNFSDDYEGGEDGGEEAEEGGKDNNVYSKSPNGLVFYIKPRVQPNVPSLKLSVLRSPSGGTSRDILAPNPALAVRQLSNGDKAFSPRSAGEGDSVTSRD